MPTTTAVTGTAPAPQGLLARFIGIITSPKATFEGVVAHPKWLGMFLLTTVIVTFGTVLPMTTEGGKQATLDTQVRQMESFGMTVNDEMYAQMQKRMAYAPYTTSAGIVIGSPLILVIFAGILFAVFNAAMGGTASFKQLIAVCVHAGVVSSAGQLFTGPLNYFRGTMASATNLSVLLPMFQEGSFVGRLAGMVDLFVIWWLIVLAMGLGVLYRRRTQPIAIGLFTVYAVIALAAAAVMSSFGGKN
jgi:hypothetical protein